MPIASDLHVCKNSIWIHLIVNWSSIVQVSFAERELIQRFQYAQMGNILSWCESKLMHEKDRNKTWMFCEVKESSSRKIV